MRLGGYIGMQSSRSWHTYGHVLGAIVPAAPNRGPGKSFAHGLHNGLGEGSKVSLPVYILSGFSPLFLSYEFFVCWDGAF